MSLNNNTEMNPLSTRYLVADFINYRLQRHGHSWINCPPLEPQPTNVHRILRTLGDEFEERFRTQFDDMVNQLCVTPDTAYPTFHNVVQELFNDGVINWGRIVALFGFGGALAVQCMDNSMPQLVDSIVDWVSTYLNSNLQTWISSNGSWDGFVEFYENGPSDRNDSHWDSFTGVIKYGVIGAIGAMALGAILTQRT